MYMGLQDTFQVGLLQLIAILLLGALTFEAFMQWKYPIQSNEYKKTMCIICILLTIIPIGYLLIPADLIAQ